MRKWRMNARYCFGIDDRICCSCRILKEQRPPYCLTSSSSIASSSFVCIQSGLRTNPRCKIISYQVHVHSFSHLQFPLDSYGFRGSNFSMQKRAKETRTKRMFSVIIARATLEDYTSKQATRRGEQNCLRVKDGRDKRRIDDFYSSSEHIVWLMTVRDNGGAKLGWLSWKESAKRGKVLHEKCFITHTFNMKGIHPRATTMKFLKWPV